MLLKKIAKQLLLLQQASMPKLCAILQLVSAPRRLDLLYHGKRLNVRITVPLEVP